MSSSLSLGPTLLCLEPVDQNGVLTPAVHPIDIPSLPSIIWTTTPSSLVALSTSGPALFMPPWVSTPATAPIYTVPSSMMLLAPSADAPAHTVEPFPFQGPQLHIDFPYQAPPPISIPIPDLGALTQAALAAPPTNLMPEVETEQERRLKKMEEAIEALQASDSCLDSGDGNWNLFPGMWLPPKINAVNPGCPIAQQYSVNYTLAPPATSAHAPPPMQYKQQYPAQPICYSASPAYPLPRIP
ncbi:hypothetical protein CDL15_Pgr027127 [Punica granatum]|uniref:Uncharacterized protein n=1 Tax=Punica granatum TaxID=22663 RepID=A0A218X612_PUNGR|nr:hypothetical protein CDL15_Pgr027127 [Punica granatum]